MPGKPMRAVPATNTAGQLQPCGARPHSGAHGLPAKLQVPAQLPHDPAAGRQQNHLDPVQFHGSQV